jgi:glycerophosphoryl diester phosphodiesterase
MALPPLIEHALMAIMDGFFACWPQPLPSAEALRAARIIAHRGECANGRVPENTLEAFDRAADAGVWGIELDVRWTADRVPVVAHDPDLMRVHQAAGEVAALNWSEMQRIAPAVPCLAEVVARYGRRLHLMIEIKACAWPDAGHQSRSLQAALAGLKPCEDFHFMALQPQTLRRIEGFPDRCRLAIAFHWPDALSHWVRRQGWGGLCTHYALLRGPQVRAHHNSGQKVGTAYPRSANSLFRELNRKVDFIFSNHAARLQAIIRRELQKPVVSSNPSEGRIP